MKFLADMGISPKAVALLRVAGNDAVHLHELELERLPDSAILEKAHAEGRIILTSDLDFGDLLAASGAKLPSVVLFRLKDMRPQNVNAHLQAILAQQSEALERGAILSVGEQRIRVRALPI